MIGSWAGRIPRHSMGAAVFAVAAAFVGVAAAIALWPGTDPGPDVPQVGLELQPPQAAVRIRCETCGVIEGIRLAEARGEAPAHYEFAVRLPDGSLRHSSDPQPGRWKVGDQMQLLGGERTWSVPSRTSRDP